MFRVGRDDLGVKKLFLPCAAVSFLTLSNRGRQRSDRGPDPKRGCQISGHRRHTVLAYVTYKIRLIRPGTVRPDRSNRIQRTDQVRSEKII